MPSYCVIRFFPIHIFISAPSLAHNVMYYSYQYVSGICIYYLNITFQYSKHISNVCVYVCCIVGYSCYFLSILVHHCRPSSVSIISDGSQRCHRWYCKYTHVTQCNTLKIYSFFVHISLIFPLLTGTSKIWLWSDCLCQRLFIKAYCSVFQKPLILLVYFAVVKNI